MHVIKILIAHKCKLNSDEQKGIFMNLNTNEDGSISIVELTGALLLFHGDEGSAEEEAYKILYKTNLSQSGSLNYSEWLIASANEDELLTDENLRHIFEYFDEKKTGFIGADEMKSAFSAN